MTMVYQTFLIFFLMGVVVSEIIVGRPVGPTSSLTKYPKQKLPSLFIGLGISNIERAYHIHHWMHGLFLLLISLLCGFMELSGFFLGITIQGLSYKDRFHIIVPIK